MPPGKEIIVKNCAISVMFNNQGKDAGNRYLPCDEIEQRETEGKQDKISKYRTVFICRDGALCNQILCIYNTSLTFENVSKKLSPHNDFFRTNPKNK